MEFIDGTVVNVALPNLQNSLGATGAEAQWIVEAYALFISSLLLIGGSLGDRFGLRRMFLCGCWAKAISLCRFRVKRRVYLEENAGAVDIKLSDDDITRLEAALRPEAVSGPRYTEKAMAWVDR